jgi:hypothetical protein
MAISIPQLHRRALGTGAEWHGVSWSAVQARILRQRFLRRMLPMAWMPAAAGLCFSVPVVMFLHGAARWTALGVIASSMVWIQLACLIAFAGAGSLVIGRQAEQSTAEVLRRMRRQGWSVMHNASLGRGRDIDHIAIGSSGVLVIETKWRRDLTDQDLEWAARQVRQSQREVHGVLRSHLDGAPVVPLVVVWGPTDPADLPDYVAGVSVVHGQQLAGWLGEHRAERLSREQIKAAWQHLLPQVQRRDAHERTTLPTPTPTPTQAPTQAIDRSSPSVTRAA